MNNGIGCHIACSFILSFPRKTYASSINYVIEERVGDNACMHQTYHLFHLQLECCRRRRQAPYLIAPIQASNSMSGSKIKGFKQEDLTISRRLETWYQKLPSWFIEKEPFAWVTRDVGYEKAQGLRRSWTIFMTSVVKC